MKSELIIGVLHESVKGNVFGLFFLLIKRIEEVKLLKKKLISLQRASKRVKRGIVQ
jgi:hypothetical protein